MNEMSMEMQRHAMDSWQVLKNRIGPILLSFLLVFACAAIITYIMPRKYRGQVKMKIERDPSKIKVNEAGDRNDPTVYSDIFLKTEFDTLTMSKTLDPVIKELNLVKRWSLPESHAALGRLRANLEPQSSVKSDFFTLDYYDEDPKLAADIANAVAQSYMDQRIEVERKQKQDALDGLKKQLTEIEGQVTSARAKMLKAKRDAGIVGEYWTGGKASSAGSMLGGSEQSMVNTREQQIYKLETDILAYKTDIDGMKKLSSDELVERASALHLENSVISAIMPKLNDSKVAREGAMKSGLGAKHPTVLGLTAQIEENTKIIKKEAEAHMAGLQNKLASAEQQLTNLKTLNEGQTAAAIDKQAAAQSFQTAMKDVEQYELLQAQRRDKLLAEEGNLELQRAPATIWQSAEIETVPTKPRVMLNLGLGAIVGLMFGIGLAFALEYLDTSVKTLDDVERFLGVPVLAVIPQNVGVLHRESGFSPDAEAYRILRTNIEFNRKDANANCITVVSGGAGEGKSTTLTNLAYVCAQGGYNVLLIDGDLRRPRLHTLFDTSNAVGLTNFLTTDIHLEDVILKTPVDNLYFLPSGVLPADGAGILNSQRMSDLIADVKSRFDLVLIDSPPILGVSDASVLANEADMTIIVVQHRKLPRQMLMRVKQAVDSVGGNVLGVVLNNVDVKSDSAYSYYTSYYTYYAPSNVPHGTPEKRKRKKQSSQSALVASPERSRSSQEGDIF